MEEIAVFLGCSLPYSSLYDESVSKRLGGGKLYKIQDSYNIELELLILQAILYC